MRSRLATAFAIVTVAAVLRAMRVLCRWDEWALHYASYNDAAFDAVAAGDLGAMLSQAWVGLHPPLYPLLHVLMGTLWSAPILWLSVSALFSLGAVILVSRSTYSGVGWLAALCLATDPVQLHYAAEVNNYPLMVLLIALAWWGMERDDWRIVALAGGLGAWTHILAGVAIGLAALGHPHRRRILGAMFLASLPLLPTVLNLATDSGVQRQPSLMLGSTLADALSRFGPFFLLLLPVLIRGGLRRPRLALAWGGTLAFWWLAVGLHIAAPHQLPYALALGVPAALLVAAGCDRPYLVRAVAALCIARGLWVGAGDIERLAQLRADLGTPRGLDTVLAQSRPEDAIVLIRGLNEPDDDKRHISPVLWRIRPWSEMVPVEVDGAPHLSGQPRHWQGRTLYTFDAPRPAVGTIPEARVFTVLYDAAAMNPERVPDHPRQGAWHRAAADLWRGPKLTER